jgi:hypothetical protein
MAADHETTETEYKDYAAAWAEYKKLRFDYWLTLTIFVLLAVLLGLAIAASRGLNLDKRNLGVVAIVGALLASGFVWSGVYMFVLGKFTEFRCPRCGKHFLRVVPWFDSWQKSCVNCGIAVGDSADHVAIPNEASLSILSNGG